MRVVPQYADVSDVVPLLLVGEHFDEHRPVVGDNLTKSAPSAQYVFEDPISNGLRGLCMEHCCDSSGVWVVDHDHLILVTVVLDDTLDQYIEWSPQEDIICWVVNDVELNI